MTDINIPEKTQDAIDEALEPKQAQSKAVRARLEATYKRTSIIIAMAIALEVATVGFLYWLGIFFSFPGGIAVMATIALAGLWFMQAKDKESTIFMLDCFDAYHSDVEYFENKAKEMDAQNVVLGQKLAEKMNEVGALNKTIEGHVNSIKGLNKALNAEREKSAAKKKVAKKSATK